VDSRTTRALSGMSFCLARCAMQAAHAAEEVQPEESPLSRFTHVSTLNSLAQIPPLNSFAIDWPLTSMK
jgi:hypothetical protein